MANIYFWLYDLSRIYVIFSFSAAEGTCEHDNATCSVNNILLFCSGGSEASASLWYNLKYFLQELKKDMTSTLFQVFAVVRPS